MNLETKAVCERADDLLSYLYGEANEAEAQSFAMHLKQCASCNAELASFGKVRSSMVEWRDEILDGFVAAPMAAASRKKSAVAALKEFFDLSPLWLKGAVAFATLLFCALSVASLREFSKEKPLGPVPTTEAMYTRAQVDEMVNKALAEQVSKGQPQSSEAPKLAQVNQSEKKRSNRSLNNSTQEARGRRPLSRSEREQLAADLRLLAPQEDGGLNLIGDRINQ
ncbi:MAG TPA: zf-HC2 domain-containing protein [Pyrinomonadaceae bacterium]|nr:zf-HC2 domain-containing protein [Pyrinomonadaceae bacterium]